MEIGWLLVAVTLLSGFWNLVNINIISSSVNSVHLSPEGKSIGTKAIQTKAKSIGLLLSVNFPPAPLPVVRAAASLSRQGFLTRVENMMLENINLDIVADVVSIVHCCHTENILRDSSLHIKY